MRLLSLLPKEMRVLESIRKESDLTESKKGFTVVEVMVAAVLIASLVAGMLHMIKHANHFVELARDNTRVTQLIQSEIEDLRTLNWTDLQALDGFQSVTPQGAFVQQYADEYYCYRFVVDSSYDPTNKKWVWVYAGWIDSNNKTHWVYYFTQFSKDGLNDYYYRSV